MRSNNLTLRLNFEALDALFPEGSQQRVELQNSVLTQAAKQYVKGMITPEISKFLEVTVAQVAARMDFLPEIANAFAKKQGWNTGLELKDGTDMAKAIADRVFLEFNKKHSELIDRLVSERAEKILSQLDADIDRVVNAEVVRVANKRIQERVQQALNTAVASISEVRP